MTINDYIKGKFSSFGVALSESDLFDILVSSGLYGEDEMNNESYRLLSIGIIKFTPSLLARPTSLSVDENGHSKSKSWNIDGIKAFYSMLCKQHGLKDELTNKPKITFL